MVDISKETLYCKKQSLNKGLVEVTQEVKILDDDLILDIVEERIDNKKCSTKEISLDDLKDNHPKDKSNNNFIGTEWDFLYW